MNAKALLLSILLQTAQAIRLIIAKIWLIVLIAISTYSVIQTFFKEELPSVYTFTKWVGTLSNNERFSFFLLIATICGFFVTFNILSINRKSESYTKILIQISDDLHNSVQDIQTALNFYEFYCKKIVEVFLMIKNGSSEHRDISIRIKLLIDKKSEFQIHYEKFDNSVNNLFSLAIKNTYIHLLEDVSKQHERLTQIASFLNIESFKYNIYYAKGNEEDFNLFESQVKYPDILVYSEQIQIGRDCIGKLAGYINGKLIASIVPTRLLPSLYIILNCRGLIKNILLMNANCIVDEITRVAIARVDHQLNTESASP